MSTANAELGRTQVLRRRGGTFRPLLSALGRAGSRLGSKRCRRVVLLLALLWLCGVFDLVFTLTAHRIGSFHELNPLAAALLAHPTVLIVFKLSTLAAGSVILFLFRRHLIAEIACWTLCGVYASLSAVWVHYYAFLSDAVK